MVTSIRNKKRSPIDLRTEGAKAAAPHSDDRDGSEQSRSDAAVHTVLLLIAIGVAWFPIEIRPQSAVAIAVVVLALGVWGWTRSPSRTLTRLVGCIVAFAVLIVSAAAGWDPARAVGQIGLIVAIVTLGWLASRSKPPTGFPVLLALGISGLAVWGIWQVVTGFDSLLPALEELPEATRAYAEDRVAGRRAYASLPVPGHLAVLLATALPLLVARVKAKPSGAVAAVGVALAVVGLAATKSPIGVGFAILAVAVAFVGPSRRSAQVVALLLVAAFVAVVALRPDMATLEPVELRADNWRTAAWLSGTSPFSGVGVSSFAQASQTAPLEVGNRPAHAHSLPLEILAELGPAGLVGCLLLGIWLLHQIRVLWPRHRALAVALAVVPLHNLVDFSFFVSGVMVPWAVLLGWGLAYSREPTVDIPQLRGRVLLILAASAAVVATTLNYTSVVVEEGAASRSEAADRFDGALRSLRLAPWRVEPQFLLAAAALETEDPKLVDRAWTEMNAHRWARPRSAALARRRGYVALARGDVSAAAEGFWAAGERGHPDARTSEELEELLIVLKGGVDVSPD